MHPPISPRWTTNRNGYSSLAGAATFSVITSFQDPKHSKLIPKPCGVWQWALACMSTQQCLHGVNYNRGSTSGREPTGGSQRHWRLKRNDRDRITLTSGSSWRVHIFQAADSRQIKMPTNQIGAISAHAHASRELRVRALQTSRGI